MKKNIFLLGILFFSQISWAAYTSQDYVGDWGLFAFEAVDAHTIVSVIYSTQNVCTSIPCCNSDSERVKILDFTLNVNTNKCLAAKDYSYWCSQARFRLVPNGIHVLDVEGLRTAVTDAVHGSCYFRNHYLARDPKTKVVQERNDLIDCQDGYVGLSDWKIIFPRHN